MNLVEILRRMPMRFNEIAKLLELNEEQRTSLLVKLNNLQDNGFIRLDVNRGIWHSVSKERYL